MNNSSSPNPVKHKLLVTIVKKGMASKLVKASRKAGAQGGTILFGKGTGVHEHASFLGIPIEPEKEIILTLVKEDLLEPVMEAIEKEGKLRKPGSGVGFVIEASLVAGISHLAGLPLMNGTPDQENGDSTPDRNGEEKEYDDKMENQSVKYDLIVTIVNKGMSDIVVDASKQAGAEGGTIVYGRGTGIHEQARLFSIQIEPEKELVLTLIVREKTEQVLNAILHAAELDKPSKGIAFVLPVERTVGINHAVNRWMNDGGGQ
jgi:nitrogen regulatory protein PII